MYYIPSPCRHKSMAKEMLLDIILYMEKLYNKCMLHHISIQVYSGSVRFYFICLYHTFICLYTLV